jgi:hypothetical protein
MAMKDRPMMTSNKASERGMSKGHGSAPAERVSGKGGIECGSSMESGGVRFKMQGPILDHSRVRETVGKE